MRKLKEIRRKNNLTQQQMASILGISQQAYSAYEQDGNTPSDEILEKIAVIFDTTLSELKSSSEYYNDEINTIEDFLGSSYTAYHSTKNIINKLEKNGYKRVYESDNWDLKKGSKIYVVKNSSAVIAVNVGSLENYAFNIAECHTDSPVLKIKGNTITKSNSGSRIDVEKYGGLILYSMLDIPLKIAGRIMVEKNDSIETKIVTSDFNINIPSLCIHHNITVNENLSLSVQNDMQPLLGNIEDVYSIFSKKDKIIDSDLYVVPDVKPYRSGVNGEYLASPRIDNLSSCYSILESIISAKPKGIAIGFFADNEEVGSSTKQGACSSFLSETLKKINRSLGYSDEDYLKAKRNGFVLSIDNGHAVHPAHPEKYDLSCGVHLNKGIMIKHHVNYATDGFSSSIVKIICKKAHVQYQDFYNKSDLRNGGTIGLVTSSQLQMNTADIGLPQLAMHSAIETVGYNDIKEMEKLVLAFFNTSINVKDNDKITLN